jgi:hypothetical protein
MQVTEPALRPAPKDGTCPQCGALDDWQLVERVQQWHRGRFVTGEGFIFEGNDSWSNVAEDGEILHLECRSCITAFEVPDYDWR